MSTRESVVTMTQPVTLGIVCVRIFGLKVVLVYVLRYDSRRVVQQLRACGVLETIRISAQSYPSRSVIDSGAHNIAILTNVYACVVLANTFLICRWTYIEFYSRYSILMAPQEAIVSDKKQTCKNVLSRLIQVSCLLSSHQYYL